MRLACGLRAKCKGRKMKDCLFCKIIAGEIPCWKIYEDDFVLAFLDIANDAYGHTLVIPKKHYQSLSTCDSQTLARVMDAVKKIGNHFVNECGFDGFNVFNNCGQAADQSIMHMHMHIVPRKNEDEVIVSTKFCGKGSEVDADGHRRVQIDEIGDKIDLQEICEKLRLPEEEKPQIDDNGQVVLYTDGACSGNPGAGGWAAILSYNGKEKVLSGGEANTTNNRMELMAVISGLESVKLDVPVQVFSDSAYVVNAYLKNWLAGWQKNAWKTAGGSEVQNKDLWQRLLAQTERLDVTFNKVKGHSDNSQNNRCDALAREEIKKLQE